ncbi:uncharacterized protein BX664DRAFT_334962 [Halteromyces radiatus]|uniref:uncharacterized protein n=1 Tax=Halteromyces radiatus TaxID=101107 RepID=UPI00221EB265|nr:uncharacterized protein BX664DRAFT_334962 [Halteromyces radiatus]KAI8086122.1 hypothetical protein BX664DRAFT_334962 [Halteromyces radiatus]
MEAELNTTLDNIASKEGVKGVLISDTMGLCLGVRGIAIPENAPFITSLATASRSLQDQDESDKKENYPTVTVEYDNMKVVIRDHGGFALAVFM